MGTNFYWKAEGKVTTPTGTIDVREFFALVELRMDVRVHIGKRSAAGLYCWDCKQTLCRGGAHRIHFFATDKDKDWFEACPLCGQSRKDPKDATTHTGVEPCMSFTWAQDPAMVRNFCEAHLKEPIMEDEYGQTLTGGEFLRMLKDCPIEYTDFVGTAFC